MTTFDHEKGRALRIDGAEIYFESVGNEQGEPLVLLHGGMGNIEDFNGLVAGLSDFRVIGIDARGHGKSTLGDTALSYERLEKDLTAVLDHLKIARAHVLGFSDGGLVGYRFAIHRPSRIQKLITIGGPCSLPHQTAAILERVTAESWNEKFPETKIAYETHNPQPDFERFVVASKQMWLDRTPAGYPNERVKEIQCPTLIVRGDQDHLYSLAEAVEIRSLIENSQLLHLPRAGHVAFDDSREMCLLGVKQFLRS